MTASNSFLLEPFPPNYHYTHTPEDSNYQRGFTPPARNSLQTDLHTMDPPYNNHHHSLPLHHVQRPEMRQAVEQNSVAYDSDGYYSLPVQEQWQYATPTSNEVSSGLTGTGFPFNSQLWPANDSYGMANESHFVNSPTHYSGFPTVAPAHSTISPSLNYRIDDPAYHHSPSYTEQPLSASPASVNISVPPAPSTHTSMDNSSASPSYTKRYPVVDTPPTQNASVASTSTSVSSGKKYTYRQEYQLFVNATSLPAVNAGPFIPQTIYKPHTNSDRKRYVEEVQLEGPLYFAMQHPSEYGIPLADALHSRVKRLVDREKPVFEGRGPSVSIRLEWPGYRQWTRQIPTKDFRSPPGPITMAKLAKNIAKCVQRFIDENKDRNLEEPSNRRWKVGVRPNELKLEDLVLVSLHHVSLGSWQPHIRLRQ